MAADDYFISCDWGTTNFRLRVVESLSLRVLKEHKTNHGVKSIFGQFHQQHELSQYQYFEAYLVGQIQQLPQEFHHLPIVAAGMSSSSIGLKELPYSNFPFDQGGESILHEQLQLKNGSSLVLISGVKEGNNVIRGEEVQAIGLSENLKDQSVLVLPGTHCKHLKFDNSQFVGFNNFMTGELFSLLTQNSILSNSTAKSALTDALTSTFQAGVKFGAELGLTSNLLELRGRDLMGDATKEENYYFLSGMLIGDELNYLKRSNDPVVLASGEPTFTLYRLALEELVEGKRVTCLGEMEIERALLAGQRKIMNRVWEG
ncbi:MAG: 2-dehydro-3-deoxygalactonokinase [Cyclobacteriaceae bacterium]